MTRITMIQSHYYRGTAFSVDVDHREYWITAKHILTGAKHPPYGTVKDQSVALSLLNPASEQEQWIPITFSVIDPGQDIDIVALAAPHPILDDPLPSEPVGTPPTLQIGSDCSFLGFPFGGSWRATFESGRKYWMAYTKHCTVSAVTSDPPQAWVLDGINNEGFSGGPVVFLTGPEQQIFAVISGYVPEPAEIISSGVTKKKSPNQKKAAEQHLTANVNSGFIIAYGVDSIIDAIHKKPIGPLRSQR
jgi:hypothetical protein